MSEVRFLADRTVGRLAKWLRLAGFDCEFAPQADSDQFISRGRAESRVLLSRDTALKHQAGDLPLVFLQSDHAEDQLKQVMKECSISIRCKKILSICSICNSPLETLSKQEVRGIAAPYIFATQDTFRRCPSCGRIFWPGTHKGKIIAKLKQTLDT
jgi:uncharacterized protein